MKVQRVVLIAGLIMATSAFAQEPAVRLYAAGSLRAVMNEIGASYAQKSGVKVLAEYGASGLLRERIEKGEAADIFASANMAHPQALLVRVGEIRYASSRATASALSLRADCR